MPAGSPFRLEGADVGEAVGGEAPAGGAMAGGVAQRAWGKEKGGWG